MKLHYKYGILLILSMYLLCACGSTKEGKDVKYSMYFINEEENALLPKPYTPSEKSAEEIIEEMIGFMQKPVEEIGYTQLLPSDVEVLSYEIENQKLIVNFNRAYTDMSDIREILVRAGAVKSLIQIPNITAIDFLIEGKEISDRDGDSLKNMTLDSFVEGGNSNINSYLHTTLELYFADEAGEYLVKEERALYYSSSVPLERVVVEQLLKGSKSDENQPTLPAETKILGVTISDNVCYVNLDETFLDSILPVQEEIPVYSIVNSLMATCQVTQVQISINGETKHTFRGKMSLDKFYERNYELEEEDG